MGSDIVPGRVFPDFALPDRMGIPPDPSELLQGDDPLVLTLARGRYCTPGKALRSTTRLASGFLRGNTQERPQIGAVFLCRCRGLACFLVRKVEDPLVLRRYFAQFAR
jgi:hypothetical protein